MRASRRFEGHIWLKHRMDQDPDAAIEPSVDGLRALYSLVWDLTGEYGLATVFDVDDGTFTLRCYPRGGTGAYGKPHWATCYKGASLLRIAAAAYEDYRAICRDHVGGVFSRTEVVRCVAS